jgi:hypothetical protein
MCAVIVTLLDKRMRDVGAAPRGRERFLGLGQGSNAHYEFQENINYAQAIDFVIISSN